MNESNERIEWQKKHLDRGLDYIPIELNIIKLYAMVNASFANNPDLSLQMGYVIVLGNERATEESFEFTGNIIHWFFIKCKRITKSVLASEVYAMAEGVNMAVAIGTTINRIIAKLGAPSVPIVVCTNFLFFYECLMKLGTIKEKRFIINIIAIRQAYERQKMRDIRWINNRNNPADAITKGTPNHALKELINTNRLILRLQGWIKRDNKTDGNPSGPKEAQ
jgi:hypothetical protein